MLAMWLAILMKLDDDFDRDLSDAQTIKTVAVLLATGVILLAWLGG